MAVDYGTKAKTLELKDRCKPEGIPEALITKYGDVGSRSSVMFWITLVVGRARHTDPASDPKTLSNVSQTG